MEKDLWEGEKTDLLRNMKELNRKIEELRDDVKLVEDQNYENKGDKKRLTIESEETRAAHRSVLQQNAGDNDDRASVKGRAREELTRSFQEKEAQLQDALRRKESKVEELFCKLRALKGYARRLKYLGEDLSPIGQPLADILTQPPPVSLDDENERVQSRGQSELGRLRQRNAQLEKNVADLADKQYQAQNVGTSWDVKSVHSSQEKKLQENDNLRR